MEIPDNINKEHIERAIAEIDKKGIRKGRHSTTYDLIYNGKHYPPKLVLSIANRFANGTELEPNDFAGGKDTLAFDILKDLGFVIIQKEDPVKSLIEKYKIHIAQTKLEDEKYKWELVNEYRGRPDTSAVDFAKEINDIQYNNLVYGLGIAVIKGLANEKTEDLRALFIHLFNENIDLFERVKSFNEETLKLYKDLNRPHSHHQDERSIATYLTFFDNTKYTFYKASFYEKYCTLIGVEIAEKNEKYVHYLKLIDQFIEKYIVTDIELINQVKKMIPEYYDGSNHKLLAQDILFQMLDKKGEEISYWIFQGNPKVYDFKSAIEQASITDWTVSAHKDKIKTGDKVILWITGSEAGCYALAEVTSEPHSRNDNETDLFWKEEDRSELKAGIFITHNLVNSPIFKSTVDSSNELKDLKVGNQGTNFRATEKQYNALLDIAERKGKTQYWLYAPGKDAKKWEEFFSEGIMALGWEKLGDLKKYESRNEIKKSLTKAYSGDGDKKNDVTANDDFANKMEIGDIVIVKKGRGELLGYGEVTSDYFYDENRNDFHSCRKVDWKLKGNWTVDFSLVLKTLTDITKYPSSHPNYDTYYNRLLGIMTQSKIEISYFEELSKFIKDADSGILKTSHYLKIYDSLDVKVSFGQGNQSKIPWIAFLDKVDSVQNGIYPVYLYYKDKNILILSYGISETFTSNRSWTLKNGQTITEYFTKYNLGKPERYGSSFVYKVYDLSMELDPTEVNSDLEKIIKIYKNTSLMNQDITESHTFNIEVFQDNLVDCGLLIPDLTIIRFIASILSKPFVILTGLSGSGKTKLAQSFVQWICFEKSQYCIIPVGADWTNREPLLGYQNALKSEEYVKPESGVLDLIIKAISNPNQPYFLILDEMNLSKVERYFADFLSAMESKEAIPLYSESSSVKGIPSKLIIPSNLFIIGTVNIDETTNMFSPKVLDRANTIEFRVMASEMKTFLDNIEEINMNLLVSNGARMSSDFLRMASDKSFESDDNDEIKMELVKFFVELKKIGSEFGYRTASEILVLINHLSFLNDELTPKRKIDIAIIQKLLPKLHGSRRKLCPALITLGSFCINGNVNIEKDVFEKNDFDFEGINVNYPLSLEKITRMYKGAIENGFTSFAEA